MRTGPPRPDYDADIGQFYLRLSADKMSNPDYADFTAQELSHAAAEGVQLTAIAGHWDAGFGEVAGPLRKLSADGAVLDVELEAAATLELRGLAAATVLVYVYDGGGQVAGTALVSRQLAVTGEGDHLRLAAAEAGMRALVLRGRALREPVAHYGPFVMNTPAEIEQAINDYRAGAFS